MKLIDGDKLLKTFKEECIGNCADCKHQCFGGGSTYCELIVISPTVEERIQGNWKMNMTTGDIFCPFCKEVRRDTRIRHVNFCNCCGAKMVDSEVDSEVDNFYPM